MATKKRSRKIEPTMNDPLGELENDLAHLGLVGEVNAARLVYTAASSRKS